MKNDNKKAKIKKIVSLVKNVAKLQEEFKGLGSYGKRIKDALEYEKKVKEIK